MKTFIAFLRGINVSGHKKIKMADLRSCLDNIELEDVQTYIQSGNIAFKSTIENRKVLQQNIQSQILKDFGFDVPVLVISPDLVTTILKGNPFTGENVEQKNLYFVLLHDAPKEEFVDNLKQANYPNEEFYVTKNCVYLNCIKGAGKAKLTNNIIEQKLKVTATTRNLRTMQTMIEMTN